MAYFTTLYSGSSGNCALIRSDDKYLLIDMGKSCRTTLTALKSLGLAVSDCVGILVTHEHSDHVSGLDTFLKKHPVPLYGCADTLDTLASRGTIPPAVEAIPVDGQTLEIGSFTVTSFPTSHDVPCCGYRIRTPEGRVMAAVKKDDVTVSEEDHWVMLSTLDYADEKNDNGTPSMLLLKLRTSTT